MAKEKASKSVNREPKKVGRGRKRWAKIKDILARILPFVPTVGPIIAGVLGADKTFAKIAVLYEEVNDLGPLQQKFRNAALRYKKHKDDKSFREIQGGILVLTGDDVLQVVQVLDAIKALKKS